MRAFLAIVIAWTILADAGCADEETVYVTLTKRGTPLVRDKDTPSAPILAEASQFVPIEGMTGAWVARHPNESSLIFVVPKKDCHKKIEIPIPGEATGVLLKASLMPNQHVFVEVHVNPSLGIGLDCDLNRRTSTPHFGTAFAIHPNSSKIAVLLDPPHFSASARWSKIIVDGKVVAVIEGSTWSQFRWDTSDDSLEVRLDSPRRVPPTLRVYPNRRPAASE